MDGDREGETVAPLHWAARNGHLQIVTAMLAAGVGVNSRDSKERTPLHEASVNGQHETVQALLMAGADVNSRDIAHITPLHDAATKGHHETVRALLVALADANAKDLEQSTPLHMAAGNANLEAVKALLKAGGDVNARDTEQRTPLHLAARNGCHETARALLMSHGVDVNAVTNQQWTPLHLAAMNGHHKTASVLLTANADVNARDEEQKTPLHLAAWNGDCITVSVLLVAGADVNVQDKWCNTPIREAEKRGHSGCVEAIQKADENIVNKGPKQKRGFDPVLVHFYEQRGMTTASGKDPLVQEAAKQTGKSVDQVKNFISSYRRSKGLQRKRKPPEEDSSNTVAKKSSLTAESTNMLESASASHSAASGTWQGLNIAPATEEHWKEGEPLHTATLAGKHGPAVGVMAAGASVTAQTDQGVPNVVVQQHVHHHLYYHQSTTQQADVSSHTGAIASQGAGEAVKGKNFQELGGQRRPKSVEVLQLYEPEKGTKKTGSTGQKRAFDPVLVQFYEERGMTTASIKDPLLHEAAKQTGKTVAQVARFIGNYRWSKGESKQKPPTDVSSDTAKNESTSTGKSTSADLTSPAAASSSRPMLNTGSIRDQKERERKEEALRGAAEKGQTTGVMQLLADGINPNAAGGRLKSVPLHEAAMYGHPKCVEVLLKHGADVYARNEKGLSAKDIAKSEDTSSIETGRNVEEIIRGRKEVLRLLLEETSKITQRKKESQAVLIRFYEEKGMTEVKKDCPLIHTAAEESGRTVEQVKRFINHRKKREDSGKRPPEPADTHSPGDSLGRVSRDTGDQGSYGHLTERGKTTTADSTSDHGQVLNTGSAMDEKEHEMKEKELCEAAENGDTVKVKQLLEQGVSIHATSGCLKRTPLHLSAENGHYNTVIALLAARATVNTQDVVQRTALHMAAVNGYHNIAKALLEAGATVNARADQQWTPVHLAAMNGHPETVSILYLAGADVNSRDEEERIPLHMAAQNGYQETVSVLLKAGSNVNIKNNEEKTSMHLAAMNGHHETVTLLAAAPGADVNSQDNKQMTPLHWAARNDDYETASALLAVDADVNARDKEKSVPLHEAAIHGHPKCVEVLLQHGADVYVRNETGLSAKDIAKDADSSSIGTRSDRNAEEVIRGRKEILKLLKEETNRMSQRKKESQAVLVRFYEEKGMTEVKKDCPLIQAAANESGRTVEQVKSFINYRKRKGKRPLQPDDNPGDTAGADDAKKAKTEDARAGGANGRGKSGGSSQRTEMFMKVSSTDKFEKLKYLLEVKIEDDVRSETYNRLVRHVAESGLCFRDEVPGDGNCMFHAVADQLFCKDGKSISHLDLRKQAVNFLRENPHNSGGDHLSAFVPEGNWDKYLDDMSRDGTWGDHIVLQAMADMLGHDISIVSSVETENYVTILTPNSRTSSVVGPPLLLGHYAENHYASLSSEATGSGTDRGTASQGPLQPAQAAISVLLVNDEYGTSRGGISTMNRQVARLLLANDAKVYGTALTATEDDKRCATKDGLNLLLPVCDDDQRTPTLDWLTYYSREHFPTIPRNLQYIFGHVDVTSKAAKNIKEKRCQDAKLVLFNHEMPEDTRYYKATKKAMRAADKETRIVEDAKSADAVFSVGSRLYSHFETEYKSLEDSEPRHHYLFLPRASQVFVETNARPGGGKKVVLSFGRVCEVTAQKGHDMAARSIGYAAEKIDNMSWVVRGVAEDVGDWEKSKKILEKKMQSRKIKPILRPYGTQQELAKDIKGAHLVLMTSRSEPFGLVGLEAIAAGIPVLISDQSGLADMIKDLIKQDKCHADLRHRIVKTSVKESDVEETARRWAEKIEDSLEYSTEEFKKAAEFKKKLLGSKSWEESHKDLLRFCGLIE